MTKKSYDFTTGDKDVVVFENDQHIIGKRGGVVVVDTHTSLLLLERGPPPTWYFPTADINMELLESIDLSTHCPRKGDASYYRFKADGAAAKPLVWYYKAPFEPAKMIKDHLAFYFEAMDEWLVDGQKIENQASIA